VNIIPVNTFVVFFDLLLDEIVIATIREGRKYFL